ncbi:tRNA (N6-threonylcarbamoyladenosine(37)-N6)-methyltransferase TrmO [Candidatus Bathyarchaeota archaeon ex4484_231]|nr:MAG: tRNA (N6-threonylcarbamoyladenosine(37)-N6)-methyltransferase TrmO [Candidatus Bathyarchaeota archaeon ex4484_231]
MRIEVYAEYAEALDGIEKLTHINVLYWMHRLTEKNRGKLKVHPRGDLNRPLTGVFTTRSPVRPNPIGLTRVKLLKRKGKVLFVKGLDALDGSPVIDIKSG